MGNMEVSDVLLMLAIIAFVVVASRVVIGPRFRSGSTARVDAHRNEPRVAADQHDKVRNLDR